MDQIRKVPIILSSVRDLQNPNDQSTEIHKLRSEMKTFMTDIKSQFSNIIGQYQNQISTLKNQSQMLKRSRNITSAATSPKRSFSIIVNKRGNEADFLQSPVLPLKTNEFYRSSNSPFYRTDRTEKKGFPSWGSAIQTKNTSFKQRASESKNQNEFPEQLINPEFQNQRTFHRSRYQRQSQRKRQRQEEIVHFLQSHKKNLDQTTNKMLNLIGKAPKQNNQSQQGSNHQENEQSNIKESESKHNQSLSQICDSLDKSFVSQKARKSKMKKKQVESQAKKKKIEQESQNQKIRKQRALKNLLQRLRQNANSINPPQIVKASKLIPTGAKSSIVFKAKQSMVVRINSKVMINPIPVGNASSRKRDISPNLSQKRPTSILKQSSNILTRSISGISAISFQE